MATAERPLSPHLQVYKFPLSAILSIAHRGTGVFLSVGALILSICLLAIASGPVAYEMISNQLSTWYGKLLILLFMFSLYYLLWTDFCAHHANPIVSRALWGHIPRLCAGKRARSVWR